MPEGESGMDGSKENNQFNSEIQWLLILDKVYINICFYNVFGFNIWFMGGP